MPEVMICSAEWRETLRNHRADGLYFSDEIRNGGNLTIPDPANSPQRGKSSLENKPEASVVVMPVTDSFRSLAVEELQYCERQSFDRRPNPECVSDSFALSG